MKYTYDCKISAFKSCPINRSGDVQITDPASRAKYCLVWLLALYLLLQLLSLPWPLSAAWFLGIYLLVDKGLSPMDALGKSRELVHEVGFWKVFITVFALSLGIQLISLIPVLGLIAMLFLYPLVCMVYVAIYEHAIKGDTQAIDADFQEN